MKNLLRSTTSLGLSLALAFPHGAFAQEQNLNECGPVGEATEFPCAFDDQTVESAEELRVMAGLSGEAEAEVEAEGEAEVEAEAETEAEAGSLLDQATGAVEATGDAAAAAVNDVTEQAEEAADAAEAQAEAAAEAAEETASEAEAEAEAEMTAEAESEVEVEEEVETEAEVEAEEESEAEVEEEAEIEEDGEAETALDVEAEAEATAEVDAEATESEETDENAEAAADAETNETAVETSEEAEAEMEAETSGEAVGEEDNAGLTEEQIQAREERREARRAERREERREQRRAEREAAAAAAAAAESDADAEVVTEEVTEEDVRSSDEDFETEVTAAGDANAAAADDDDSGMSDFEKALLLGLGAVAVGSVLNNGEKIVSRSGDRVVVQDDAGELRVLKDDNALLRRPGDEVQTQTFDDGSTRTIVTKSDGSRVETIRSRDGTVLRRTNFDAQGREYVLVDDLVEEREVVVNDLPQVQQTQQAQRASTQDEAALRQALQAEMRNDQGRTFSLRQVREIREVRSLAPELELDAVRFPTGSAAIQPEQARALANIGTTLRDLIQKDPRTVILVEGHTDAVGDASYNLALSDRRAETVALALTEYFDVPPANLITQGYGESQLRVPTTSAEPANRRAVVRNITGLLR
ncbi:OmpA family protein [Sulfitobacter sp. KE29]|uniref:OmpA family protein n=1 Tax=unclassified Sulfitobacter TaxID=196795 RepID=UPI0023E0DBF9|nr:MULTISPECIES: OmpA family protein [unclassified Sulfitobacter]MDF3417090.1 OmpA family protein [Sulfitobacter sp. Ks38]MDF3424572.1 OmpA family protein [Sulfitobacter sp. KE29]MDF3428152.1 OmpA family protein [Sulfitobacter sp. S46]MDF3442924.1 OmpA family protein [Sulfitobacter sp. KE31]MDF3546950.1 OmpA family protein [Sulfitobacter sp. KE28]